MQSPGKSWDEFIPMGPKSDRDTSTALKSHSQITAGDNCAHKILERVLIKSSKTNTSFWVITEHELANSDLSAMSQIDKSRGDI